MTQKQQTPNQPQACTSEEALSGNKAAGDLAKQAASLMEQLLGSTVTTKISDLQTKKEKLLAVANAIEQQELLKRGIGFNMKYWHSDVGASANKMKPAQGQKQHSCGTVACIAGWTALMEGHDSNGTGINSHGNNIVIFAKAQTLLELNHTDATDLFVPGHRFIGVDHDTVTPARAVAVIRHYAETGIIDWYRFNNEGKSNR